MPAFSTTPKLKATASVTPPSTRQVEAASVLLNITMKTLNANAKMPSSSPVLKTVPIVLPSAQLAQQVMVSETVTVTELPSL